MNVIRLGDVKSIVDDGFLGEVICVGFNGTRPLFIEEIDAGTDLFDVTVYEPELDHIFDDAPEDREKAVALWSSEK